jgi:hypothetical protein
MGPARRRAQGTKRLRPDVPPHRWCRTHKRAHQRLAIPGCGVSTACARCLAGNSGLLQALQALGRLVAEIYHTPLHDGPDGPVVTTCA